MKATVRLLWLLPALCLVLSGCSAATESMMDTGYKSENGMLYMDAGIWKRRNGRRINPWQPPRLQADLPAV